MTDKSCGSNYTMLPNGSHDNMGITCMMHGRTIKKFANCSTIAFDLFDCRIPASSSHPPKNIINQHVHVGSSFDMKYEAVVTSLDN